MAGIITACLISEVKIDSLHCGESRGQKSPEQCQFSLQWQKHLELLLNYLRSNGAIWRFQEQREGPHVWFWQLPITTGSSPEAEGASSSSLMNRCDLGYVPSPHWALVSRQ